jgi:dipeptidyl-peptidase 4
MAPGTARISDHLGVVAIAVMSLACWPFTAIAETSVSADDYARAERLLPANTAPLVLGVPHDIAWQSDGSLRYEVRTSIGERTVLIDPVRRIRRAIEPTENSHPNVGSDRETAPEVSSPDGRFVVFIRTDNLWMRDFSGNEAALTTDGQVDFGYATDNAGWKHTSHPVVLWSPDSRRIATYQQNQRGVGEMYLLTTNPGHPQLKRWKYAMAGDPLIPTIQRVIIDIAARQVIRLQMPPDPHRSSVCYDVECGDGQLADAQWSPDGTQLAFVSTSRDHKQAVLRVADAATGAVREVLREQEATYYESDLSEANVGAVNWRFLPRSGEVVWYSTRHDWAHLYLYDLGTGHEKHQITRGPWNVIQVLSVDEAARVIYFLGVGRESGGTPYDVRLYRVGFDGNHLSLLTPENGTHEVALDPSRRFFIDTYSTPEQPTTTLLRSTDGRIVMPLEKGDASGLIEQGWKPPQVIKVKARDGRTDLYGLLFAPSALDPARKYPIVDYIYPGPQIGSVNLWTDKQQWHFAASRGDAQSLAELGFIVVEINGLGTELRSKHFHDSWYGNMADNTLPDQVNALHELAQRYSWIDLSRVGVYGHSGGGYAAAAAMFRYPDLFKVGISESGNHDQTGYTDDWGEKFQGLLERDAAGRTNYDTQASQSAVDGLKGHLLLAHGTQDENVPTNLTLLLVDALIKANKDFDLVLLPNQNHEYTGEAARYMTRRRWDYFVKYLLGAQPPAAYLIKPGAGEQLKPVAQTN